MASHYEWDLEIVGKLIAVKARNRNHSYRKQCPRGSVTRFSRASRLRMLKLIAKIDWTQTRSGLFITLTYPDDCIPRDKETRNLHRWTFHRYMEKYLNKKIPLLWRVEWVQRQTGLHKGKFVPHFHLLTFGGKFIPHREVRRWWAMTIGASGPLATDIHALGNEKKIGIYVSKYAAKVSPLPSLDNVAYLSRGGRHWGVHYPKLVPTMPKVFFKNITPTVIAAARRIAEESLVWYDREYDKGFCLLGELATQARAEILSLAIDEGCIVDYDV